MKYGFDVSKWQSEALRGGTEKVDYIIIRRGLRGYETGVIVKDEFTVKNRLVCKKFNLPYAFYFYSAATTQAEAIEERRWCLDFCKEYEFKPWAIFIDTECVSGRCRDLTINQWKNVAMRFCNTIKDRGYKAGIYCSESWRNRYKPDEDFADCLWWVANWSREPSCYYDIWQFTNSEILNGERRDCNKCSDEFFESVIVKKTEAETPADNGGLVPISKILEVVKNKLEELMKES